MAPCIYILYENTHAHIPHLFLSVGPPPLSAFFRACPHDRHSAVVLPQLLRLRVVRLRKPVPARVGTIFYRIAYGGHLDGTAAKAITTASTLTAHVRTAGAKRNNARIKKTAPGTYPTVTLLPSERTLTTVASHRQYSATVALPVQYQYHQYQHKPPHFLLE